MMSSPRSRNRSEGSEEGGQGRRPRSPPRPRRAAKKATARGDGQGAASVEAPADDTDTEEAVVAPVGHRRADGRSRAGGCGADTV